MRLSLFTAVLAAGVLLCRGDSRADVAGDAARRAQVVVTVGLGRTITGGELEDRIAALPPFQRATFGADAAAVRRAFLEQVLVPETLESLGAEGDKLGEQQPTSYALERVRSQSVLRAIRARLGPESAIPIEDVEKYYDDNRARYDTPERLQIWRILCKTKEEAQTVLDAARKEPTPKEFGELAREHSIDKASNLRAGNLGFIAPDGTSNEPGLKVEVSIVHAAQGVRDGQLVSAPVPEGENYSVVWRKGPLAATRRTVDQVAAQICDTVWKTRVKEETDRLTTALRAAKVHDLDESLLATLGPTPSGDGGGAAPRGSAVAPAASKK